MFHFLCMYLPDSDLHAKSISDWHFYETAIFSTNAKWALLQFLLQSNSNLFKIQKRPFFNISAYSDQCECAFFCCVLWRAILSLTIVAVSAHAA